MISLYATAIFPAYIAYNKAICKRGVDQIKRCCRSPSEIAAEINNISHNRYELMHKQYLSLNARVQKPRSNPSLISSYSSSEQQLNRSSNGLVPFGDISFRGFKNPHPT